MHVVTILTLEMLKKLRVFPSAS